MVVSRRWGLAAVPAAMVAILVATYLYNTAPPREAQGPAEFQRPAGRPPGFRERASEEGLRFHQDFLPDEQGWDFKINPYDHGSGIAVGDYDGDGRDDVYFVNQLGPNALYHNNGDGTFTDVTREAGVALGDRVCVAATFADYDNSGT
jgi:hypothetical protein